MAWKNGKVTVYKYEDVTTEEILAGIVKRSPQTLEGALGDMYYQIIKHIVYYARKYDATATVSYSDDLGGRVLFDYAKGKNTVGLGLMTCFELSIYNEPISISEITSRISSNNNQMLKYKWHIQRLYREEEVPETQLTDKTKIYDWSMDKYVGVLETISSDIYGQSQGRKFCDFMTNYYDKKTHSPVNTTLEYSSIFDGLSTYVMIIYPDVFGKMNFYTDEVGVKQ